MNFSSWAEFLKETERDDREFLSDDEISNVASTSCAMANSSGGWIILGAVREFVGGRLPDYEIKITGLKKLNLNIHSLIPRGISFEVQTLEKILIIKIYPLSWREKPLFFNGTCYRRVEGVNLISSRRSTMLMTFDSFSFIDDGPAMNFYLNPDSLNEFHERVIKLHDEYKNFSPEEFLCRSFIFSGKFLTFAGALMFGNIIRVRVVLASSNEHIEIEAQNIWDAYKNILPRLVKKLSPGCSQAFQEIFINSVLHSDYRAGNLIEILITSKPLKVLIINPGIIRDKVINPRLKKIFGLSGITIKNRNLESVKKFMPTFRLEQDMINFRVKASLKLEGNSKIKTPPTELPPVIL